MKCHQAEASETGYAGVKVIREKSNENLQQDSGSRNTKEGINLKTIQEVRLKEKL